MDTIARYNEFYEMVKARRNEGSNGDIETKLLENWKMEREGPLRLKRKFGDIEYSTDVTNLEETTSPMDSFDD